MPEHCGETSQDNVKFDWIDWPGPKYMVKYGVCQLEVHYPKIGPLSRLS